MIKFKCFLLLCCFIGLFHANILAQKTISIPLYANDDTTLYYQSIQEWTDKTDIPVLISSNYPYYFRFWSDGQLINIWEDNQRQVWAQLINFTKFTDDSREKQGLKVYSQLVSLDSTTTQQLLNLSKTHAVNQILSDNQIKGWQQGQDGITYVVEVSTPTSYIFKEYWTPSTQVIPQAKIVLDFIEKIEQFTDFQDLYNQFIFSLPEGCYVARSIIQTCIEKVK